MTDAQLATIAAHARRIRRASLSMVHAARLGHPGGDLSCADILATLFCHVLRVNPSSPQDPNRDRFILSKGHASAAGPSVGVPAPRRCRRRSPP